MATELEQKTEIKDPYRNLEEVFGPYVRFIEEKLKEEESEPEKPIFEKSYTVKTLQDWDEKKATQYECGNRIIAPESILKFLLSKGAETPIILQIFNVDFREKISHCSVIEWIATNDTIYVPSWMMLDFCLQRASKQKPKLALRYYEKPFLKGSFVQIQPFTSASIESDEFKDVQKLFEESLKKYQCLTIGDILRIKHNKNTHYFEITDVLSAQSIASITRFNVVSIVNTDISVDFLPPKDAPKLTNNITKESRDSYSNNIDNNIIQPTKSSDHKVDSQQIDDYKSSSAPGSINIAINIGTGHELDTNTAQKKEQVQSFANIKAQKIICDQNKQTTRIQIELINGKKETVKVNLTTTINELYAHAKLVSGYEKEFQLLNVANNSKPLTNPDATVETEQLNASRIRQKAL